MRKVLVAECDLRTHELLSAMSKSRGYEIVTAGNSGDVLRKIQNERINVCFLDFALPGIGIADLVSIINELRKNVHIIITADRPEYAQEIKVRSKNIFYFAHKPINPDEIEKVLRAVTELIKEKEHVIEDDMAVSNEKLSEVIEKVINGVPSSVSKDSGEKYDEVKRQHEVGIKYVIGKFHDEIFKIDARINRNAHNLGGIISENAAKLFLPITEVLCKTFIRPAKFINKSVNSILIKATKNI